MEIFRSSYYLIFFLQAVGDFYMFLTVELLMRPRKYNYFNMFNEDMHTFAVFTHFNLTWAQNILICGNVLISANRLTVFYRPLAHERYHTTQALVVIVTVVLSCSTFYVYSFILARKSMHRNRNVERNLLICAAASFFPFCIELIRDFAVVWLLFDGTSEVYIFMTELWYFGMEIATTLPMWLQVIVNKSLRKCLFDEFVKKWNRWKSTSSTLVP
ncbi:hypothetical protein ANCCAN_03451 [Ancylostoma caninum]|uniref:Uncharacterized protein n=1 Tax=Ancylostoma caninum TaxID=29170 RepID=A0A368H3T4_ANCCA|nr:hypothetical protein ANCCAN_03451 [Ancylostoma caninum]